jgi:endoribonuclease Dicer
VNNNNNNNNISKYRPGNSHIVLPISGTGSMLDKTRDANLQSFKTGQTPLLVSTSALEEGIDVPECSFIIRYDDVKTAKAHIQGSGRARCLDAEIFYFENDPDEQIAKAKAMDSIAKDSSLNLSRHDLKIRLEDENKCLNDTLVDRVVYPFYLNKNSSNEKNYDAFAQVNFFNCIQILFEYVQIVMKQSFDPEDSLLEKKTEVVSFIPFETRTSVLSVSYPSPRGIVSIDLDEIDFFWKGLNVEDVVTPVERLTNMSSWDIEKRRAIYVTVVKMHEEGGLLTASNKPTVDAINKTKIVCPVMKRNSKINVKNKFNTNSLKNNS